MRKIYLVRHAQADINISQDDIRPLTEAGQQASKALVPLFEGVEISAIYSSPYARALATVTPIAERKNLTVTPIENLIERRFDQKTPWSIELVKALWDDFDYVAHPGDESIRSTQTRSIRGLNEVLASSEGDVIVGVHGTSMATMLNYYDNTFGFEEWKAINNPDVYTLIFEDNGEFVIYQAGRGTGVVI